MQTPLFVELSGYGINGVPHRKIVNVSAIFEAVYTQQGRSGEPELQVQLAADLPPVTYKGRDATIIWDKLAAAHPSLKAER